jgi:hypothetical protein
MEVRYLLRTRKGCVMSDLEISTADVIAVR